MHRTVLRRNVAGPSRVADAACARQSRGDITSDWSGMGNGPAWTEKPMIASPVRIPTQKPAIPKAALTSSLLKTPLQVFGLSRFRTGEGT
jgi:hypothetical protein